MNTRFISQMVFLFLLFGCTGSKQTAAESNGPVTGASYEQWFKISADTQEPSERGVDIIVTLQNLPEGAEPMYIIFNNRRSFPPDVTTSPENEITVEARIILESDLLADVSARENLSDRLVFKTEDGNTEHIEIDSWEKQPNRVF